MTRDELYPVIDEVLRERWHPYAAAGSYWIATSDGDVELNIHELAEALCDAIVGRLAVAVVSGDIVERLRNYALFNPRFAGAAAMMTFCDEMRAAADEIERLRAENKLLTGELQQVANERALAESEEARRER